MILELYVMPYTNEEKNLIENYFNIIFCNYKYIFLESSINDFYLKLKNKFKNGFRLKHYYFPVKVIYIKEIFSLPNNLDNDFIIEKIDIKELSIEMELSETFLYKILVDKKINNGFLILHAKIKNIKFMLLKVSEIKAVVKNNKNNLYKKNMSNVLLFDIQLNDIIKTLKYNNCWNVKLENTLYFLSHRIIKIFDLNDCDYILSLLTNNEFYSMTSLFNFKFDKNLSDNFKIIFFLNALRLLNYDFKINNYSASSDIFKTKKMSKFFFDLGFYSKISIKNVKFFIEEKELDIFDLKKSLIKRLKFQIDKIFNDNKAGKFYPDLFHNLFDNYEKYSQNMSLLTKNNLIVFNRMYKLLIKTNKFEVYYENDEKFYQEMESVINDINMINSIKNIDIIFDKINKILNKFIIANCQERTVKLITVYNSLANFLGLLPLCYNTLNNG